MTRFRPSNLLENGAVVAERRMAPSIAQLGSILRMAAKLIRRSILPLALALLLVEFSTAGVLAPLSAAAVDRLVRRSGRYAVANTDLAEFALSPAGIVVGLLAVMTWVAAAALGRAAAILLFRSGSPRVGAGVGAFASAAARGTSILSLAALQTLKAAALAVPFLAVIGIIAGVVLRGVDLNWLVTTRPARFWLGLSGMGLVGLAGAVIVGTRVLGWSVALPICVCERLPARAALRESRARLRGRSLSVAAARVGWLLACGAAGFVTLAIAHALAGQVLRHELRSLELTALTAGVTFSMLILLSGAVSIIASAGNAAVIFSFWHWTVERSAVAGGTAQPDMAPVHGLSSQRSRLGMAAALVVLLAAGTISARHLVESIDRPLNIELTAHRGAETLAPENTLAAIRAAVEAGADRVEIDVMRSRDGVVVLMHDTDLRRIAGDPRRVADLSLAELQAFDVGAWFDPRFAGERIPTLEEVIAEIRGRTTLNIELKPVGGDDALLGQAVVKILQGIERGPTPRPARPEFIVTSLAPAALEAVRHADPTIPVGLVVSASVGNVRRMDVGVLSVEARMATPGFIAKATGAGQAVHVWTVNDPDRFSRLALQGAASVITSDVRPLRARLDELRGMEDSERLLLAFRAKLLDW